MQKINLDQVCYIKILEKQKHKAQKVTKEINTSWLARLFGFKPITVTRYYDCWTFENDYIEEGSKGFYKFLNNNMCYVSEKDGEIYYRPHIEFHMSDGYVKTKWYASETALTIDLSLIQQKLPNLLDVRK